jgi:hypothetical protein
MIQYPVFFFFIEEKKLKPRVLTNKSTVVMALSADNWRNGLC